MGLSHALGFFRKEMFICIPPVQDLQLWVGPAQAAITVLGRMERFIRSMVSTRTQQHTATKCLGLTGSTQLSDPGPGGLREMRE
jgi:hypothetical protein